MSRIFKALTPKPPKPSAAQPTRPEDAAPKVDPSKAEAASSQAPASADDTGKPREVDGPQGPEPTRYGDWERGGICYDF